MNVKYKLRIKNLSYGNDLILIKLPSKNRSFKRVRIEVTTKRGIMKKVLYSLVITIFSSILGTSLATASPATKRLFDFRRARWGMTKTQVLKTETAKLMMDTTIRGVDLLIYTGEVAGFNCNIGYIFAEGKLVRGKYMFTHSHSNKNDYILDFNKLKEILTKKYGKPIEDKRLWKNDLYRDDPQYWGFAISLGHLIYLATWETPATDTTDTTIITLLLNGENFEIMFCIEYLSKNLHKLEEKAIEKKSLEEL